MKLKHLALSIFFLLSVFTMSGCNLVFEPDVDAVARLFASMPTGDNRVIREMCDGEDVCRDLSKLSTVIRSDWYGTKKDFYEFEEVEIAEDTGRSYVHVKIRLPGSGSSEETMLPLVIEMERIKLRWHVYNVRKLDDFLRRAERARGIL